MVAQPLALVLIGLPGSGKSTWAQSFVIQHPQYQLISTDMIRAHLYGNEATQGEWEHVWAEIHRRLREAATPDSDSTGIIYDATNARRRYRRRLLGTLKTLDYAIGGLWFDIPLGCCLQRNQKRTRQVPETVIWKMARQLQGGRPAINEGFDWLVQLCPPEQPVDLL
ncbi:MAG: AAA family ATPase [Cyanobacteria bacterium P01_F01_bin.4]